MANERSPHPHAVARMLQSVQLSDENESPQHSRASQAHQTRHYHGNVGRHQPHGNQSYSLLQFVRHPLPPGIATATQTPPQFFTPQPHQQSTNSPRGSRSQHPSPQAFIAQCEYLDHIANQQISRVEIGAKELAENLGFCEKLRLLCQQAFVEAFPQNEDSLQLLPYGSFHSGFAVTGSDVDLSLSWKEVYPEVHPEFVPRLLEGALLKAGLGARLLTKTRVPLLKICQLPTAELLDALQKEREKWEGLEDDQKYPVGRPSTPNNVLGEDPDTETPDPVKNPDDSTLDTAVDNETGSPSNKSRFKPADDSRNMPTDSTSNEPKSLQNDGAKAHDKDSKNTDTAKSGKHWTRERVLGPLDFPKNGVGIQCDINWSSNLGLYNTKLLRCYAACDARVRPMVLFVKAWAKRRQINSPYHGTLSSYGWVLMILHFLINVIQPPLLPNLQHAFNVRSNPRYLKGYNVTFADDEAELSRLASEGKLTQNKELLGSLLRNFFHYYAHQGPSVIQGGFRWTRDVLSLRTPNGLLTKESKGWTGATRTMVNNVEVRQRYLLAIEDPFEVDHNVGRTVVHNGIVAIREEFRRAWRLLETVGSGFRMNEHLLDEIHDDSVASPTRQEQKRKSNDGEPLHQLHSSPATIEEQ